MFFICVQNNKCENVPSTCRPVQAGGRHGARERGVPDALQLLAGAAQGPLPGHADAAARARAVDLRPAARAAAAARRAARHVAGPAPQRCDTPRVPHSAPRPATRVTCFHRVPLVVAVPHHVDRCDFWRACARTCARARVATASVL